MELKYKNWKDISVNTFQKLQDRLKNVELTTDDTMNNINYNIIMLSVLCDVDEDIIVNLTTSEFSRLVNECKFMCDIPKVKIQDKYVINGNEYNVFLTLKDMNVAQYIDFQTLYKEQEKYFKELLACFLIPKGKKYGEGYKIDDVVNEIGEHLSIVDARSIMFFFVLLYQSLTKVTLNYSIKKIRKELKKEKNEEKREQMKQAIAEIERARDLIVNGTGFI